MKNLIQNVQNFIYYALTGRYTDNDLEKQRQKSEQNRKNQLSLLPFEDRVKAMKVSELVQAMVDGLRRRWVLVDMCSFGDNRNGLCYGCAATNAICQIKGESFTSFHIEDRRYRAVFLDSDDNFLYYLENAFDYLRMGDLISFNVHASIVGLRNQIPAHRLEWSRKLPSLHNSDYEQYLHVYQEFADELKLEGY